MNPWFLLGLTILSEVIGIYFQKSSNGYERIVPTVLMGLCFLFETWGVGIVMKQLEMGITYAIWAGVGTALAALMGMVVFNESVNAVKVVGIICVILGVVLLNWTTQLH